MYAEWSWSIFLISIAKRTKPLLKHRRNMVNKAVILLRTCTMFISGCYDCDRGNEDTVTRCQTYPYGRVVEKRNGKFRGGVKASMVSNPLVVSRGIFNYYVNKTSLNEYDRNEKRDDRIWRKPAYTSLTSSNWIVHVSTMPLHDVVSRRKSDYAARKII